MTTLLSILLGLTLLSVAGSLAYGLFSFLKGGEESSKISNEAMRWRVILQGVALLLFFLILWIGH